YRFGDIYLFENEHLWVDIRSFNPEFTISMLLIYMMVYWFNEFFLENIKIREEEIKNQKMQKEFSNAKYMALKAQIEPHFLFNSLSVLNSIVHKDPDLASEFIVKLSKTLRYIVEKNNSKVVYLKEEMLLVTNYFFLLKTRFEGNIKLTNNINKSLLENCIIPPVTIQMLLENAVNHNKHSEENPLEVIIEADDEHIIVKNTLNLKNNKEKSTGKGIENIIQRYELLSGEKVIVNENEDFFTVKLPILKNEEYEHFNN
ncbi:MAG: histidine kinase, partial [Bacteroidota bacterium]|nr:histidine kinase [Bacteroidota bacterium]